MSEASLKEKTAKGLFWGGFSNGTQQLLNLLFGIILARLLNVSDYGMIGMLTIFSAIAAALQEGGFIAALTNRKEVSHKDYNAVFWFSTLCGITLYVALFFRTADSRLLRHPRTDTSFAPLVSGFCHLQHEYCPARFPVQKPKDKRDHHHLYFQPVRLGHGGHRACRQRIRLLGDRPAVYFICDDGHHSQFLLCPLESPFQL